MRRWLLDLHLYLGLFCLPYVIVFGISSILLNHQVLPETKHEWQVQVAPLGGERPILEADRVWAALDRSGRVLNHTVKRGDAQLRFQAIRPGRSYQVAASSGGQVNVVESKYGVLGALRDLHGLSDTKSSRWLLGWSLYTELTAVTLVASIASGAILMLRRVSGRSRGLWAGGVGIVLAAALIAGIW